ncbi:hypothetical protein GOBAR_AA01616 [Gossypium barbadense]|uniref:Rx N-terminal domain-containing protein n=1 Tax=Gossypium barbadense TaxID=3634 RepID=A0A2P5YTP3_GOSBA|nr:hypothetical protein GOBAR_AA01616 [Gossypium barbadense]
MVKVIAFDIAVELIIKLSSRALSQIGLWWNLKHDLDDLKSTVSTIKTGLLDAEERSVTSHLVKDWLDKLKDILYDADDLLNDFSTEALRKDLMGGNKLTKRMGRQIKAIKARLTSIERFGGLAKTALAQFVYNDKMVHDHFELKLWLCVSDVFYVKVIVENTIKSATGQALDLNLDMDQLQKQLQDKIDGKSICLLWMTFGMRRGKNGNKFEQRYADSTNLAFVEIEKQILERYGRVPLVIRMKASILSYKETEKEWSSFKDDEFVKISQKEDDLNFEKILHSIYKLKHLRYLDVSDNPNLKILPKNICKIQNLQALKLDWCGGLEELPKKIEKLVNLTHLACCGCSSITHMPHGIGKLSSLETLSMFVVDKDGSLGDADLRELSGLNNLRGEQKFGIRKKCKKRSLRLLI